MASSNVPARAPEPQPQPTTSTPRPSWPKPDQKPSRQPLRVVSGIPN
jgi:hypothetical protein